MADWKDKWDYSRAKDEGLDPVSILKKIQDGYSDESFVSISLECAIKLMQAHDKKIHLLPCPFCGGTPEVDDRWPLRVFCPSCGAQIPATFCNEEYCFNDAIEKWNSRSKEDSL